MRDELREPLKTTYQYASEAQDSLSAAFDVMEDEGIEWSERLARAAYHQRDAQVEATLAVAAAIVWMVRVGT